MTPEMQVDRLGRMTASKAAVVMGGLKTDGLRKYINTLAFQRVFGDPKEEGFKSKAMERGNDVENLALDWYAFETGAVLTGVGTTAIHADMSYVAASPDAMRADRVIEAKSPLHEKWMEVFESGKVPAEYRWQIKWQMWVTGLHACDFVVWHPLPGGLIIQATVTAAGCDDMRDRAVKIEARIQACVIRLKSHQERIAA